MTACTDPEMEMLLELLVALEDREAARRYDTQKAEIDAASELDALAAIEQALIEASNALENGARPVSRVRMNTG